MVNDVQKSEVIQELLVKLVSKMALKYDNYFQVIDSNMISDEEMYIYIDRWHESDCEDVYGNPISIEAYKDYLKDFKKYCDEFTERLEIELPSNIVLTKSYSEIIDDDYSDDIFYESCELCFKLVDVNIDVVIL